MIKDSDVAWLRERFPELVASSNELSGKIAISASYNEVGNQFQVLYEKEASLTGGLVLSGEFEVRIEERLAPTTSILPALFIIGLGANADRHLSPDGSACLCTPFVENEYFTDDLNFTTFFEQLVIPFLYGQLFYEKERRWPWNDYAHGVAGLLESYPPSPDVAALRTALRLFQYEPRGWSRINKALNQHKPVSPASPCICGQKKRVGNCHPKALLGLNSLRADMKKFRLRIS